MQTRHMPKGSDVSSRPTNARIKLNPAMIRPPIRTPPTAETSIGLISPSLGPFNQRKAKHNEYDEIENALGNPVISCRVHQGRNRGICLLYEDEKRIEKTGNAERHSERR